MVKKGQQILKIAKMAAKDTAAQKCQMMPNRDDFQQNGLPIDRVGQATKVIYTKYYKHSNESCTFSVFWLSGFSGQYWNLGGFQ